MKLTSLLTAALFPMGLIAAPVTEEAADVVARESIDVSANEPARGLFKRNLIECAIVGASVVNCRAGPGTNYPVVGEVQEGGVGMFSCVKSGECINIGGSVNCGWDFAPNAGCYINGHYTDDRCTLASLGWC